MIKEEYKNGLKDFKILANRYDFDPTLVERIVTDKKHPVVELIDKRRAIVSTLWKEGKTVNQIMTELNLTRMAVIYHIDRMPDGKFYKKAVNL